jgi:hypothetical protein
MPHVDGDDDGIGYGVRGVSNSGDGVFGDSNSGDGVFGRSVTGIGVFGRSDDKFGTGVYGTVGSDTNPDSEDSTCVFGDAFLKGTGVHGKSLDGKGAFGESQTNIGVHGKSGDGSGVFGESDTSIGVVGQSYAKVGFQSVGVRGMSLGIGVQGFGFDRDSTGVSAISDGVAGVWLGGSSAGEFFGGVDIVGDLTTSGTKSFKIDHPLDPSNKYLYHSSVESPDMKNVYDGVAVLDHKGEAVVVLAAWFEALNKEFRYQLTPIGAAGPNLHIAEEISKQRFKIAGGSSGMKVCWQVTGIRQDAFAKVNPLVVEQDKLANERDYYLHPEAHGYPAQKSIVEARYHKELRQFREVQQKIT